MLLFDDGVFWYVLIIESLFYTQCVQRRFIGWVSFLCLLVALIWFSDLGFVLSIILS